MPLLTPAAVAAVITMTMNIIIIMIVMMITATTVSETAAMMASPGILITRIGIGKRIEWWFPDAAAELNDSAAVFLSGVEEPAPDVFRRAFLDKGQGVTQPTHDRECDVVSV